MNSLCRILSIFLLLFAFPAHGGETHPGGTTGQLQYNNGGYFGGFTLGGDCTWNSTTKNITCTKTAGNAFATSATTDTTTTANITDSSNKRFVTNANLTVIGNTSGTNTGDQTAGTGLTLTTGAFSVNTSQSISKLSNLTSNGFVKTGSGDGTLSIDTNTYLTTSSASSTYQPLDSTLTSLAGYNTNGILAQTAADTFAGRTLTAGTGIGVSNGNGVSGNPTVAIDSTVTTNAGSQTITNKDLTSGTNTFPTFNQNTTGSAAKWTTARNLAGNSVDGSAAVAFANKYIVQGTSDAGLSAAQFMGSLGTGIVKNTTTTGVQSIAVAGDFPTLNQNTSGSAATLTTARSIYGNNFDGSAALAQIIASTFGGTGNGFAKFSGPATSEKTYTLPNASAAILTDNALVTSAQGGTGNAFFALSGPASSTKTYTLPNATTTILTTNAAVTAAQGGTGLDSSAWSQGDVPYISATGTWNHLAKNASATRYLSNTGTTNNPAWAQVDVTNGITGVVPGANLGVVGQTYPGDAVTAAQTIVLVQYAPYAFTINSLKNLGTVAGTVTGDLKINSTVVTGCSSLSLTSTPAASTSCTAANVVAAGDKVSFVTSSASSLTGLVAFSMIATRN